MKYFTDDEPSNNRLGFMSTSWAKVELIAGESRTFSYMLYKGDYRPPLLTIEKQELKEKYFTDEKATVKGEFRHTDLFKSVTAGYDILDKSNLKLLLHGELGSLYTTIVEKSVNFDKQGNYILRIRSYFGNTYAEYNHDFQVFHRNQIPSISISEKIFTYYLAGFDLNIKAVVSDQDLGDATLTVRMYMEDKLMKEYTQVTNDYDIKTFTFKIPEDTKEGLYHCKLLVDDGKATNEYKFEIKVRSNTKISVSIEDTKLDKTYTPGSVIGFTAVVFDPDSLYESSFTVSVLYNSDVQNKVTRKNDGSSVRIHYM